MRVPLQELGLLDTAFAQRSFTTFTMFTKHSFTPYKDFPGVVLIVKLMFVVSCLMSSNVAIENSRNRNKIINYANMFIKSMLT